MLDICLTITFFFWGPSRHHFYNFCKSDSIIEIEKSNWFLLSEPNPWQLTWLTYWQMRRSKEQRKWNVDFYLSRYVNMYLILTFIKNKDDSSFEFSSCCSNPDHAWLKFKPLNCIVLFGTLQLRIWCAKCNW